MAAAVGGGRRAALAHLVRQPGRRARRAAARRAARADRALARAAAAVEGRAARRRLPALVLGRAAGLRDAPTRSSRCRYGMRADVLDAYPFVDPARVHVIHNGIDTALYAPATGDGRRCARYGIDPDRPIVIVRRPDHPAEGRRRTCSRPRPRFDPDDPAGAVRRRAGHPGDRGRDRGGGRRAGQAARRACSGSSEMLPRAEVTQLLTHADGVRLPVGLRAAGHRQPRGDGLRDGRRRQRASAASPRSSPTA